MAGVPKILHFTSALLLASVAAFAFGCNSTTSGNSSSGATTSQQSNAPTTTTTPGTGTTGTTTGITSTIPTSTPSPIPTRTGAVQLAWALPTSGAPTNFSIESSPDGTTFTVAATVAGTLTSTLLTNVVNGTKYYYRIRSSNSAGYSAYSPIQTVTAGP
jgi:hypothetical protein